MNLNALATLAAILEHGSFAAAAARVGCTPSAVSLQVRQLETYFGRPLFDRSGRGVRPTETPPGVMDVALLAKGGTARLLRINSAGKLLAAEDADTP